MRSLSPSVLGSCLAVIALSCQSPIAPPNPTPSAVTLAVTAGALDDGDPAVVAIVPADDPTALRCTGTVISERVVLTAAHCGVQHDPTAYLVFFGSELGAGGTLVELIDVLAHPDYDDTATDDLALLLLGAPSLAPAIALLAEPLVAGPPPVPLRLVGFGNTGSTADDSGRKREGWTQTTEVADQFVTLGADPSLPCTGDSGGPALATVGADELLAAVVSRGDATCISYSKATRVDVHLDGFILPYLAATAPGSVTLGEPCLYDEHCASGICPEAVDEPLFRVCSQTCTGDGDCPEPMTCQDDLCRYPIPSPGATGAPCTDHSDCLRGECLEDEGYCSLRCVTGRGDCPTGYECTYLGGVDFFCTPTAPPRRSGCATHNATETVSPGSLLGGLLLVFALLALLRRRR